MADKKKKIKDYCKNRNYDGVNEINLAKDKQMTLVFKDLGP
jgi:hypothetical protein